MRPVLNHKSLLQIQAKATFIPHLSGSQHPIPSSFRCGHKSTTQSFITTTIYPNSFRGFSTSGCLRREEETGLKDGKEGYKKGQSEDKIADAHDRATRTPWHREGSDVPPAQKMGRAGASAMTKGKLLTTPSRLLKLIFPLTTLSTNPTQPQASPSSPKTTQIEPLALLVHPQQPLSYLERLIQSEIPTITTKNGHEKVPDVWFRAEDGVREKQDGELDEDSDISKDGGGEGEGSEELQIDGKTVKVGKVSKDGSGPGDGNVETYSGKGREASSPQEKKFVRWSSSTEIGDFIRDAARGSEFCIEIESPMATKMNHQIPISVPSFNDRTHYLRIRLRKTSQKLETLAKLKEECDNLAHRSAQRLAMGGFAVLVSWWGTIYYLTFWTRYGWDTMEPITYLAGLSTIMLGYLWFLYHNREVSYRAALNLTVSRRQNTLYQERGFDVGKWEALIEQANALRREIKEVAEQYDVEWDEKSDEGSGRVHDALRKERRARGKGKGKREEEEEDDDDGEDGGKPGKGGKDD